MDWMFVNGDPGVPLSIDAYPSMTVLPLDLDDVAIALSMPNHRRRGIFVA